MKRYNQDIPAELKNYLSPLMSYITFLETKEVNEEWEQKFKTRAVEYIKKIISLLGLDAAELEQFTKELCEWVICGHILENKECHFCKNIVDMNGNGHDETCPVPKAEKWLKDN